MLTPTSCSYIFSTDTPTTDIYTLSLHDALPICSWMTERSRSSATSESISTPRFIGPGCMISASGLATLSFSLSRRSEEHTSELQSHVNLVCRLLLEKKNTSRSFTPRSFHVYLSC